MIRRGKAEGWLSLPQDAFRTWAALNGVGFHQTMPGDIPGRGGALLAKEVITSSAENPDLLLTVPHDLILSLERCREHARADKDYREVLESIGDFGRTPRGAILSFLLLQASMSCPRLTEYVGVHSSFLEYIKSLPLESLPTFWTSSELELMVGTTLAPAVSAKMKSLRREYDSLLSNAANTRWFKAVEELLDFDDWLQVDAMYRSRALDIPAIGHCMVPCVDLANHASGDATIAVYEKDADGNAVLLLRDGKELAAGDEITITYGDEKGACEMLFSYGFLEDSMESAECLFLSLVVPDDDSFQAAKMKFADCAPGFKLIDAGDGEIDWSGEFVWLLCVNEEDGLRFDIAVTIDGETEIEASFQNEPLSGGASELHKRLAETEMWDIYRLRAITILQQRVFAQLQVLYTTEDDVEELLHGEGTDIGERQYQLAMKLRTLEFDLLNRAYENLEQQKLELAASPAVVRYLEQMNNESQDTAAATNETVEEEDFS